jgi:hypothetical protein
MISRRQGLGLGICSAFALSIVSGCGAPKRNLGGAIAGAGGESGEGPVGASGRAGASGNAGAAGSGASADLEAGAAGAESAGCAPGDNKDCYESAGGKAYPGMPPAGQTTCKLGQRKCQADATWGPCVGAVEPEAADTCEPGNDANCNGVPNEGCTCGNGETCSAGSVCSADGSGCKLADGQACLTSADCASAACTVFNLDADNDGYRADATPVKFCGAVKSGYVSSSASKGDDCNDANVDIHPGAPEICDGIDNDCDGKIDMAGNPALKLSGNTVAIGAGTDAGVGAVGKTYGVVFSNVETYYESLSQNNVATGKVELDPTYSYGPTFGWDGTNLGIFYKTDDRNVHFRKATAAGLVNTPDIIVANAAGSAYDPSVVHMPGGNWLYAEWGAGYGADWAQTITFDGATPTGNVINLPQSSSLTSIALSGSIAGLAYHGVDSATNDMSIDFSTRDNGAAVVTQPIHLRTGVAAGSKPAIAARTGGGFAVMYNDGTSLFFEEVTTTGSVICGPLYKSFVDFEPDQMVPTKRGYLAVSGANGAVKAQEVIAGCTWGATFTGIGTSTIGTGYGSGLANIAAATNGFAIVWDDRASTTVYGRTFGLDLCN